MDKQWYLGAMNDALFIIDKEPRPSPVDYPVHDRDVEVICKVPDKLVGDLICKAVNSHASLTEAVRVLTEGLEGLEKSYVDLLTVGRDRIIDLGGQCNSVETMIAGDYALRTARAALTTAKELTK